MTYELAEPDMVTVRVPATEARVMLHVLSAHRFPHAVVELIDALGLRGQQPTANTAHLCPYHGACHVDYCKICASTKRMR